MPPALASFLTLGFVAWLFRRDIREKPNITGALWIPLLWFLIITTRAVSTWLGMFGISAGGVSLEGGSTVDASVYFALITAGLIVLGRRQVSLSVVLANNRWLGFYLLFCLVATTWSDFPFVAFKRWAKDLGHPIMVLILMTEPSFEEAFARLLKRAAYVIVPVSILFIKYYPQWGRGFAEWSGQAFNMGITESKNALGFDLLILTFFFIWHVLRTVRLPRSKSKRDELVLCLGFGAMIWWLLSVVDSKTPLVSLFLALAILFLTGLRWVEKRRVGIYILSSALIIVALELTVGIYESALELLGRDATLTERTFLWRALWNWDINPIFGTGFESFWLGERRQKVWDAVHWPASEAHNGYLETYLHLGLLGLGLMLGLLAVTYWKVRSALLHDPVFGRFRFAFFFAILIYNWTEAALHGLHPIWFMFFLIAIDYPRQRFAPVAAVSNTGGAEADEPDQARGQYEPVGI